MHADGGFHIAVFEAVVLRLLHTLFRLGAVTLFKSGDGGGEIVIQRLIGHRPAGVNAVKRRMRAMRYQLVTAFQDRHDLLHLVAQRLQALLYFLLRRAVANQAADIAKFRFHFRAFLRGNIDADRAFQIFKDLKIRHLHLLLRLIGLALLVELVGGIQPLRDVVGKGAKILRGEWQHTKKQQTGDETAAGGHDGIFSRKIESVIMAIHHTRCKPACGKTRFRTAIRLISKYF